VSDVGLKHISQLPKLTKLWLDGTAVTDSGLKYLSEGPSASNIKILSLQTCEKITDVGLKLLANKFSALSELFLADCDISRNLSIVPLPIFQFLNVLTVVYFN